MSRPGSSYSDYLGRPLKACFLNMLLICLAVVIVGCAGTLTSREKPGITPNIPAYSGPKARIAVSRFDYKAAKGRHDVGEGLATMLTTELVNSGRFIVLERENLEDVMSEQDLGASGRVSEVTRAPTGEISGAELLVMGAVTAFEPNKMGIGGALLGGATVIGTAILHSKDSNIPIVGAGYKESYLSIDIRLVDTARSRVLSSLTVEGKASDFGAGILMEVGGGKSELPLAFGGWQKTSAEKAMRIAIARAVEGIVGGMPGEYYRYSGDVYREGELMGYSFLDFPVDASPVFNSRSAVKVKSWEELGKLLESWELEVPQSAAQINFSNELIIAAIGGEEDRGGGFSVQKIVNDPGTLRIEIAVLPKPDVAEKAKKDEEKMPVPFFVARVADTGKPLEIKWIESPVSE